MRNRGSIISVVTSSAGLELTLSCPVCGKPGVVVAKDMKTPILCPNCHQAFQLCFGGELRWGEDLPRQQPLRRRRARQPSKGDTQPTHTAGVLIVLAAALVLPLIGIFWWSSSASGPAPTTDDVLHAARGFTEAWLSDDLDRAAAWVDDRDLQVLRRWWNATRAVLAIGRGRNLRYTLLDVDLTERSEDEATVRVLFRAGRSDQQRLQTWKKTEARWKFVVPNQESTTSDASD